MQKSACPLWLLIGDYKIPENFDVIAAVRTSRFPVAAALLRNQFGIYWLWAGGCISSCDQKEAQKFVTDFEAKKSLDTEN